MTARVLLVDDEPDAQELFRQNFRREIRKGTIQFDFAQSGEAALEVLDVHQPPEVAVVLSDINMPGMSGIDLLTIIHRKWPDLSVFMITAYGDKTTETKVETLGAERFFSKPVDFGRLKQYIAKILAGNA